MTILDFANTDFASTGVSSTRASGAGASGAGISSTGASGAGLTADSVARFGVALIQLHDDLWRVTRRSGEVLGYVERSTTQAGHRFVAKRMLQRQRRFLPIGEFWSLDDAMDCFRF